MLWETYPLELLIYQREIPKRRAMHDLRQAMIHLMAHPMAGEAAGKFIESLRQEAISGCGHDPRLLPEEPDLAGIEALKAKLAVQGR